MSLLLHEKSVDLLKVLKEFVENNCIPSEQVFFQQLDESSNRWINPPVMEDLKSKAKTLGIWNLFLSPDHQCYGGKGLTHVEYALFCEEMGRSFLAPEACNCSAPDTGNMEVLIKYGTDHQRQEWLGKLLDGTIRSAFLMTEPEVASSDALNISSTIQKSGESYILNGRKWWSSGACDEHCKVAIFLGKMVGEGWENSSRHRQHSMVIVPMDTPGIKVVRHLTVFGYDDAPHGHAEVLLNDVRVPCHNILLGEGRGFEIAQGRLGPGRVHHCMRAVGLAERALGAAVRRSIERQAFGAPLSHHGALQRDIAQARIDITQARLLVLHCAAALDRQSSVKEVVQEIAMIKVVVPNVACKVIDTAIQIHGGAGVCQDFFLARAYAWMRTLRIADGPDDVHIRSIAIQEFKNAGHQIRRLDQNKAFQEDSNFRQKCVQRSKL